MRYEIDRDFSVLCEVLEVNVSSNFLRLIFFLALTFCIFIKISPASFSAFLTYFLLGRLHICLMYFLFFDTEKHMLFDFSQIPFFRLRLFFWLRRTNSNPTPGKLPSERCGTAANFAFLTDILFCGTARAPYLLLLRKFNQNKIARTINCQSYACRSPCAVAKRRGP